MSKHPKRILVEVEVGGIKISKNVIDPWWGDNPNLHAEEFLDAIHVISSDIAKLLRTEFEK